MGFIITTPSFIIVIKLALRGYIISRIKNVRVKVVDNKVISLRWDESICQKIMKMALQFFNAVASEIVEWTLF